MREVMKNMKQLHTFAVCAYKESPYLEDCLQSLMAQTVDSHIIMATSTPNDFISSIAEQYNLPLFVNHGEGGITQDWNFAYTHADSKYVTIAHQDDIYEPAKAKYAESTQVENPSPDPPRIKMVSAEQTEKNAQKQRLQPVLLGHYRSRIALARQRPRISVTVIACPALLLRSPLKIKIIDHLPFGIYHGEYSCPTRKKVV